MADNEKTLTYTDAQREEALEAAAQILEEYAEAFLELAK